MRLAWCGHRLWAEEFHLVALDRPGAGVFDLVRVEHTPAAVDALVGRLLGLERTRPRFAW